jgi:hypothetical protein
MNKNITNNNIVLDPFNNLKTHIFSNHILTIDIKNDINFISKKRFN